MAITTATGTICTSDRPHYQGPAPSDQTHRIYSDDLGNRYMICQHRVNEYGTICGSLIYLVCTDMALVGPAEAQAAYSDGHPTVCCGKHHD